MNDSKITLAELKKIITDFRDARDWKKYHHVKDVAMAVIIEMGELMEHFHFQSEQNIQASLEKKMEYDEVRYEFADVYIYLMVLADSLGIDISSSVQDKLKIQAKKYPVKKMIQWGELPEKEMREKYNNLKKDYRQKRRNKITK